LERYSGVRSHESSPSSDVPAPREAAKAAPAPSQKDRALEPSDALTRYMAELRNYPPISREEEHALGVRWVEEGDVEAARKLVVSNLRLVVKIAMEYRRAWTSALDLIQEGNLGLVQAAHRFDPYQGVRLSSYAAYWIRAYILKYILDNIRIVRLGKTRAQRKLFFRLNKEKRELEAQGFRVEPRLLAERLDVSEDEVRDMEQRLAVGDVSLNAPSRRDEGRSEVGDFFASGGESAEASVAGTELRRVFLEKVREFAMTLGERERRIIDERVLAEDPKTLQNLGDEFGVSRERVRQLEARLVTQLSEYLKENLVDFEYYAPSRS
jgi:RNA polymerase sigma-32 factor